MLQALMRKFDYADYHLAWNRAIRISSGNIMGKYLPYAAVVIYVVLSLSPMLSSGYYSDDMVNSSLKGSIEIQNISIANYIKKQINDWLIQGRLFPLGLIITYTVAYYINKLVVYKTIVMVMVIINILLLGKLTERISGDKYVALLTMIIIPILFQFRLYHDPILAFRGMTQIFMTFMLSSLILFIKYLETNRLRDIIISLLFYNFTLYIYEISVPLITVFICLWYFYYSNKEMRININKILPHVISAITYIIALIIIRQHRDQAAVIYSGITMNMDYASILWTYIIQIISSMPLSYYIGNPSHIFNHEIGTIIGNITLSDVTVMIIFMAGCWYAIRKSTFHKRINVIFYLGASFVLFPAMPVALTSKYQKELMSFGPGMGYLPVYIQYYGTILIIVGMIAVLMNKIVNDKTRLIMHIILLTVFSTILLLNIQNNRLVVDKGDSELHYSRVALERSLKEGILQDIPDNATLVIQDMYEINRHKEASKLHSRPGLNQSLIYLYTKRKFVVICTVSEEQKGFKYIGGQGIINDNCYLLIINSYPEDKKIKDGFVQLFKIKSIVKDSNGDLTYQPERLISANYPS
jgi:hypothetical protein